MKKKILLFHHHGGIGGAGLSLLHILKSINKQKYSVTIICPSQPDEMSKILQQEECELILSSTSPKIFAHYNGGIKHALSFQSFRNIFSIIKDKKRIDSYIKEINPDIVIVNSMTLFWIGNLAKKQKKQTVCFHRETYIKGLFGVRTRIIKGGLSKWFDSVVFISNHDSNESKNIKAKKYVVHDRVEFELYKEYEKKEAQSILNLPINRKYILYLGGFSFLKGADVVTQAMKHLKDSDARLVFVGDYNSFEELKLKQRKSIRNRINQYLGRDIYSKIIKIISENELENVIIFRKRISNPEVFYKACDVITFPSTLPHQSRPIYEAGISRIPIIITDFLETKEFATNGHTAITFEKNNAIDLSLKIKYVFDNPKKIRTVVEQNYERTVKKHDYNTLEKDLERILSDLNV